MIRWLRWPVWNDAERRPRALVRVALQLAMLAAFSAFVQLAFAEAREAVRGSDDRTGHPEAVFALGALFMVSVGVTLQSVRLGVAHLDRRSLDALGFRVDGRWWVDLAYGVALGAVLMLGILGAEVALGLATYGEAPEIGGDVPRWAYVPATVFAFVSVAVIEEVVFRGYQLTNLAEGLTTRWTSPRVGAWLAVALSSLVFGLAHAMNPHADLASTGNIVAAGLMLAAGYVATGELAIPIGLHLGWNLFQNLFGMPVSGQTRFHFGRMLERDVAGPAWLTGGDFGPEAGMTGLVAMILGTGLILLYVRLRYGALRMRVAPDARGRPSS
ncbi:MAG TPA: CPBP family intramembrane glutamic endopeptidase [Sandaracinaceae bacterium LLY-WYZ-13_1]|nr:CPBP family intramembrane glutamic endopeptidase [Sandaracinaceae bacterium LLY-WYZ-13_1]